MSVESQPDGADKCSSGSDVTDESINLQDFVVVPSEVSSPDSPPEEALDFYSDAQLKALLDEAITYKAPKEEAAKAEDAPKKRKKRKKKKSGMHSSSLDEGPLTTNLEMWVPPTDLPGRQYSFLPRPEYPLSLLHFNRGLTMQDFAAYRLRSLGYPDPSEAKPEPKKPVKREGNAIVRRSHEIDGYRGSENIDLLVKFIESSDAPPAEKPVLRGRPKKVKKTQKAKQTPKKKPPAPQVAERAVEEVKLESRVASGSTSPCPETSDFRLVMKKKKKPKN